MKRKFRQSGLAGKAARLGGGDRAGEGRGMRACMCVCVYMYMCGRAEGSAVGVGHESGILLFKLSEVGQFHVMTRCRVLPQEWAAERTKGKGLGVEELRGRYGRCPQGHSNHSIQAGEKYRTKVRCPVSQRRGEGPDDDISLIHLHPSIHSFIQEILIVDFPHREPGRQGSLPDGPCHLQGPTTMHAGPFLGGGECGGPLDPWQEGLLHGHGGIWSGSIGFPMDVLGGGLSRKEEG